jgi:predicted nucleic acid-binding protein
VTVYVESNFILEIALGQEQALAAEAILARAEQGGVKLALPAFSLSEPFHTIRQRGRNRKRLEDQVGEQMHDLERSMPHQQDASALSALAGILAQVDKRESDRLLGTIAGAGSCRHCANRRQLVFRRVSLRL